MSKFTNMTENVKELKPVEQGSYNIYIYFNDGEFEDFVDILGYQIGATWIAISLKDGTTFAFPTTTVKSIKHYPNITKE